MKISALLLAFILLLNFSILNAWNDKQYSIEDDSILMKIKENLPERWSMYFQNNRLYISRDTAFSAIKQKKAAANEPEDPYAGNINAMRQPDTIRYNRFSRYLNVVVPKMTEYQFKVAKLNNQRTRDRIENLPKKYNLRRGLPGGKSPVGPLIFPSAEIENAYKKEKDELEARIVEIPAYYSQNYSFGFIEGDWLPANYTLSIEAAAKEIETVNRLLGTYLGKY